MRYLASLACSVVVVGLVWGSLGAAQSERQSGRGAPAARVASGDVLEVDRCMVTVSDDIELASKLPGRLMSVEVKEGVMVRQGMELARLDDRQAQINAALKALDADNDVYIRAAETQHKVDVADYEGSLEANRRVPNAVSQAEVRKQHAQAENTKLGIEQAHHKKKIAAMERDLAVQTCEDHRILSPIDGQVTEVLRDAGESVQQGEPVFRIIRTDRFKVRGQARIDDAWRVEEGQLVEFRAEVPDVDLPVEHEVYRGKVTFVDPNIEPVSRRFRIQAEVQNLITDAEGRTLPGHLRAGMQGRLWIFLSQKAGATRAGGGEGAVK